MAGAKADYNKKKIEHKTKADFDKDVKNGQFERVYVFAGTQEYLKREALDKLRALFLPAGLEALNETTLENASAQDIISTCETFPVMCDHRITVVRDWSPLLAKGKSDDRDVERMEAWLKDTPEGNILIFYMTVEPDGRKKMTQVLNPFPGYIVFNDISGPDLVKWCNNKLKPQGKKITGDAVDLMQHMAGSDLRRLETELNKLASYVGESANITTGDVQDIVSPSPEYTVFMILDKLLEGDLAGATAVLNAELKNGPNHVQLINRFENQLRLDMHIRLAQKDGRNITEVGKMLGITNPYRTLAIAKQIRNIPAKALEERFQACVDADFDTKSGKIDGKAALNALMFKLVMPKKRNF